MEPNLDWDHCGNRRTISVSSPPPSFPVQNWIGGTVLCPIRKMLLTEEIFICYAFFNINISCLFIISFSNPGLRKQYMLLLYHSCRDPGIALCDFICLSGPGISKYTFCSSQESQLCQGLWRVPKSVKDGNKIICVILFYCKKICLVLLGICKISSLMCIHWSCNSHDMNLDEILLACSKF